MSTPRWFVTNPFEKICAACKSSLESSSPRIGRGENKWIFELPPLRFLLCKHWWFGEVEDNTSEVKIWVTCSILHLFTRLKILKEKVVSFCEVIFRSSLRVGSYIPWSSFTFMATTWIQVDTSIYIYIYIYNIWILSLCTPPYCPNISQGVLLCPSKNFNSQLT